MNDIYEKLRQIRKSKGLTLKDISDSTGLSSSFLSQVERGKCDITLASLCKIASTLDVALPSIFDDYEQPKAEYYHTVENQLKLDAGHSFLDYHKISGEFPGKTFDAIRLVCDPHFQTEYEGHDGEELLYVLKGRAAVTVANKKYYVSPGETIHYPSNLKHTLGNDDDEKMEAIIIFTQLLR